MFYVTHYDSPVGRILLAARDDCLAGVWIAGQRHGLPAMTESIFEERTSQLTRAYAWLDCYFAGEKPTLDGLRLSPSGSPFRQTVWAILREIPYGCVTTYGEIAKEAARRLGKDKMSAQAVGNAVGHNPLSIIVPCHRVVGAGGNLTGYDGGIDKKVWLLTHEGVNMTRFY